MVRRGPMVKVVGLIVVGSGGDGPMVGNCGLMGMGRGSDSPMVMVLVPMGHGSPIYWLRGVSQIWW